FHVGNTLNFTVSHWVSNMELSLEAHIDAFALTMVYDEYHSYPAVEMAFQAAQSTGFKLLSSFDYASNDAWPQGRYPSSRTEVRRPANLLLVPEQAFGADF
ncbi:hypothetical protein LY78DRAFT_567717, partial [Colletotrichum sublineola]